MVKGKERTTASYAPYQKPYEIIYLYIKQFNRLLDRGIYKHALRKLELWHSTLITDKEVQEQEEKYQTTYKQVKEKIDNMNRKTKTTVSRGKNRKTEEIEQKLVELYATLQRIMQVKGMAFPTKQKIDEGQTLANEKYG